MSRLSGLTLPQPPAGALRFHAAYQQGIQELLARLADEHPEDYKEFTAWAVTPEDCIEVDLREPPDGVPAEVLDYFD